jgi:hypothetical protein
MIRLQRSMLTPLQGPAVKVSAVRDALQSAIKLEHATIPPYLYALYSLDAAKNPGIANIIKSVVIEEMLHMTLSANVLNALGGAPQIDRPGFIPTYPGPLPGGVESDLTVNLAPFSMKQLQTFIQIEEPENPLNFKAALALGPTTTIGEFYTAISDAIGHLGEGAFVKPPRHQVGPDLMRESVVVTNVATAQQAIAVIIEQGEGTSASPEEVVGGRYAHYYRFMEIQKGHLLVPVPGATAPDQKYAYTGTPVAFDATGVYSAPTNPALPPGYPAGSPQAFANHNFNYAYTSLLLTLHELFNGQANQEQFNRAIGLMMSLEGQAKAMMAGIPYSARVIGPSFEYQPVNPSIT